MPTRHEELLEEHRWYTGEHKNADEINLIISTKLTHVSQFPFYAQALAEAVHEGQVDKAGQPYIDHVRRVVAYTQEMLDEQYPLEGKRPGEITTFGTDYNDRQKLHAELISVAWMHDVLEDTPGLTYYHLLHRSAMMTRRTLNVWCIWSVRLTVQEMRMANTTRPMPGTSGVSETLDLR